jgi:pyridoxal 5'-phosphate synthase pdxT subunit
MKFGVLALQGDFREHIESLKACGVNAIEAKSHSDFELIDALVIPGGESTTISKLAKSFNLFDLIKSRIYSGMPTYGSCAGMIMVANTIIEPASGQESFGGIDITVRRNAFGRQVESFESDLSITGIAGAPVRAVFIRAPWVESWGSDVEILASVEQAGEVHPVAVRQGTVLATSFHPELTKDHRIHQLFVEQIAQA